jgi:hypothetical protein
MITEWELECAIYSRFDCVLPDLHSQGYRIERQILINGISRRMDLVLMRDGHAWIVELKRGSPNVADTTAQILDYQRCWSVAYPKIPVSLMVISTGASAAKIKAFVEHGIFYRAVPESKVLEALSAGQSTELLGRCNRLPTEDEGRIRFLLSNFAHTSVPDGMRFGEPWSHDSVFYALIRDGRETKKPWLKNIYVKLFDHKPNCAVLYHSEAANTDGASLHINPRAKSWPADGWLLAKLINSAAIEYVLTDNKGSDRENGNFDHYRILNWDAFAKILDLNV